MVQAELTIAVQLHEANIHARILAQMKGFGLVDTLENGVPFTNGQTRSAWFPCQPMTSKCAFFLQVWVALGGLGLTD